MRGLVYKDVQLFFRSIDKKLILIAAVAIALLLTKAGVYGGLMGSIMLAMTVSMQNIMTFATDEKVDWKKYQKALPISNISVIASKYLQIPAKGGTCSAPTVRSVHFKRCGAPSL